MARFNEDGTAVGLRMDRFLGDTILDGEMVVDVKDDGTSMSKFLVTDALIVDGNNLMERKLDIRLGVNSLVVPG